MPAKTMTQDQKNTVPSGTAGDNLMFFRSWMQDPLRAGAFKPSSLGLARAMADRVDPAIPGPVVELGPGTGAITRALVEHGVDPARLVLVEADPNFCALLQQRWPMARVVQGDAFSAPLLMRHFDCPAAAVVAGLPLLVRPPSHRLRLVTDCLRHAAPGAPFVQFTYFFRSPVPAPRPGLRAHGSGMIWRNLWPARVWTYRMPHRRAEAA